MDGGLVYLIAATLPILAGLVLLYASWKRWGRWSALIVIAAVSVSTILSGVGLGWYLIEVQESKTARTALEPWTGSVPWLQLSQLGNESSGKLGYESDAPGIELRLGYHIDVVTAALFLVISLLSTLIHVYAVRYMSHALASENDEKARLGTYARFFGILSISTGAMMHLVLADNLVQIFVFWELSGLCSYLLVGFYHKRPVGVAALKTIVLNQVGAVGFVVGMIILWTYTGTLSLVTVWEYVRDVHGNIIVEDGIMQKRITQLSLFDALRTPAKDSHDELFAEAGQMMRVQSAVSRRGKAKLELSETGPLVVVWNQETLNGHYDKPDRGRLDAYDAHGAGGHGKGLRTIPYWMLGLSGAALFFACMARSAQAPLQVWLPEAMIAPTPVNALLHSATLVSAGIYLAVRLFPLFVPEVLMVIAYVGVITALLGAVCALVQTDIKRLLAYSTMSQLGLMMAALGMGGWTMALFHLCTHAFCGALLFVCAGSVIQACHGEQNIGRMGGLRRKMPWTAGLMLFGCLSLAGLPLLPCWYSINGIIASLVSFASLEPARVLLVIVPLLTLFLTAMSLFRLWVLVFCGTARDEELTRAANEAPGMMRWPVLIMALAAVVMVWLPNPLNPQGNWWVDVLAANEPGAVREEGRLGLHHSYDQLANGIFVSSSWLRPLHELVHLGPHGLAMIITGVAFVLGGILAWLACRGYLPREPGRMRQVVMDGFGMDRLYQRVFGKPIRLMGLVLTLMDRWVWDGIVHGVTLLVRWLARIVRSVEDFLGLDWLTRRRP